MAAEKEAEVEEDDEELTRDANTSRWAGYIFFLRGMGPTASMLTLFVITLCSACKAAFQGYLKGQFSRASFPSVICAKTDLILPFWLLDPRVRGG